MDRYFEPWLHADVKAEHYFPLSIYPMQQGHGKKLLNTTFQKAILEIIQEQNACRIDKGRRLGLRIVFLGKFRGDLDNCIKMICDGMKRAAFHDDDQIDYFQVVREHAGKAEILVQVLERS